MITKKHLQKALLSGGLIFFCLSAQAMQQSDLVEDNGRSRSEFTARVVTPEITKIKQEEPSRKEFRKTSGEVGVTVNTGFKNLIDWIISLGNRN